MKGEESEKREGKEKEESASGIFAAFKLIWKTQEIEIGSSQLT